MVWSVVIFLRPRSTRFVPLLHTLVLLSSKNLTALHHPLPPPRLQILSELSLKISSSLPQISLKIVNFETYWMMYSARSERFSMTQVLPIMRSLSFLRLVYIRTTQTRPMATTQCAFLQPSKWIGSDSSALSIAAYHSSSHSQSKVLAHLSLSSCLTLTLHFTFSCNLMPLSLFLSPFSLLSTLLSTIGGFMLQNKILKIYCQLQFSSLKPAIKKV